jgi:ribose transport system permease protein
MNIKFKKIVYSEFSQYFVIISTVIIFLVFGMMNKNFLGAKSIQNILSSAAPLLLMAGGITFVLLCGSIDLSTGAICTCACVITGLYITKVGNIVFLWITVIGILAGLLNGFLVARLKLPSFIVTLCTLSIWKCIALVISGGKSQNIPLNKESYVNWAKTSIYGIPILFIIALVVFLFLVFVERSTAVGKRIYATGANEKAARMMGVNTVIAKITAFLLSGIGSALSGAFYALRLRSSIPTIGDNLNLLAIAAVVLGGTQLFGGEGSVLRTLFGVISVTIIQSGMNVIGVDAYWQNIVFGLILIVTIFLNSDKINKDVIMK